MVMVVVPLGGGGAGLAGGGARCAGAGGSQRAGGAGGTGRTRGRGGTGAGLDLDDDRLKLGRQALKGVAAGTVGFGGQATGGA